MPVEMARGVPPEMNQLFDSITSADKRSRIRTCRGCLTRFMGSKLDRCIEHLKKCEQSDQDLVRSCIMKRKEWCTKQSASSLAEAEPINLQRQADDLLVNFISVCSLPISMVESADFILFCGALRREYKVPSRYTFTKLLLRDRARKLNVELLKNMKDAHDHSLTGEFDCWTFTTGFNLLGITITSLRGNSILLDLVDCTGQSVTADFIATAFINAVDESGIKWDKFVAVTSDEAASCKLARKIICNRILEREATYGRVVLEHRCMPHLVNLIGSRMSAAREIRSTISDLTILVATVGRSKKSLMAAISFRSIIRGGTRPVTA